jgi:hypothetical protein
MRIVLVSASHAAIGRRIPDHHLPPLGLFSIGSFRSATAMKYIPSSSDQQSR